MNIKLSKPFASNSKVDEFDTRQVKKALNRLGYYVPYAKTGITGIPDAQVFAALKKFQSDHGLPPTGALKPDDVTVKAMNEAADKVTGQYIWRTVGDNRVRDSHAELADTVRDYDDSPDPGEEFNCRCWGEAVKKRNCQEEEITWINALGKVKVAEDTLAKEETAKEMLQKELEKLKAQLEKESNIVKGHKAIARGIGGALGIAAGSILAGIAGAAPGLSAGSNAGVLIEEGLDIARGQKADIQLKIEIHKIEKQIKALEEKINNVLKPAIIVAKDLAQKAEKIYLECLRNFK